MTRKKIEIDTGKLLQSLDDRHEELLRDLEDLNLQIEQALSQLRGGDQRPMLATARETQSTPSLTQSHRAAKSVEPAHAVN